MARVAAQRRDEREAIDVGHHHVGDHQVGSGHLYGRQTFSARGRELDSVGSEQSPDVLAHVRVVVDDQDALGTGRLIRPGIGLRKPPHRLLDEGACSRRNGHLGPGLDVIRRRAQGHPHRERGPLPQLALHAHLAAVERDQVANESQSDPGPLMRATARAGHAMEALEELGELVFGDPAARVAYHENRGVPVGA